MGLRVVSRPGSESKRTATSSAKASSRRATATRRRTSRPWIRERCWSRSPPCRSPVGISRPTPPRRTSARWRRISTPPSDEGERPGLGHEFLSCFEAACTLIEREPLVRPPCYLDFRRPAVNGLEGHAPSCPQSNGRRRPTACARGSLGHDGACPSRAPLATMTQRAAPLETASGRRAFDFHAARRVRGFARL